LILEFLYSKKENTRRKNPRNFRVFSADQFFINGAFVPMYQDDTDAKPASLVCDMDLVMKTYEMALQRKQIQPVLFG